MDNNITDEFIIPAVNPSIKSIITDLRKILARYHQEECDENRVFIETYNYCTYLSHARAMVVYLYSYLLKDGDEIRCCLSSQMITYRFKYKKAMTNFKRYLGL